MTAGTAALHYQHVGPAVGSLALPFEKRRVTQLEVSHVEPLLPREVANLRAAHHVEHFRPVLLEDHLVPGVADPPHTPKWTGYLRYLEGGRYRSFAQLQMELHLPLIGYALPVGRDEAGPRTAACALLDLVVGGVRLVDHVVCSSRVQDYLHVNELMLVKDVQLRAFCLEEVNSCGRFLGVTGLAVTNVDGLDKYETLKICTGYDIDGTIHKLPPADRSFWDRAVPVYEEIDGWQSDTTGCTTYDQLPENAKAYLTRLGELCGAPIAFVGVGPDRTQTLVV